MNKEIEEMQKIIKDRDILDPGGWGESKINYQSREISECLFNAGYRKQVWHKVADGDLPKKSGMYYCFCANEGYEFLPFNNSIYKTFGRDDVIAWTELPTYEE